MDDILYKEYILELYRDPLHKKNITHPTMHGKAVNQSCGDDITVMLLVDDTDRITDAGHQGVGCAISQAAVSLLIDWCIGKTIRELNELTQEHVIDMLGIHVSYARKNCATLGYVALTQAMQLYERKNI